METEKTFKQICDEEMAIMDALKSDSFWKSETENRHLTGTTGEELCAKLRGLRIAGWNLILKSARSTDNNENIPLNKEQSLFAKRDKFTRNIINALESEMRKKAKRGQP